MAQHESPSSVSAPIAVIRRPQMGHIIDDTLSSSIGSPSGIRKLSIDDGDNDTVNGMTPRSIDVGSHRDTDITGSMEARVALGLAGAAAKKRGVDPAMVMRLKQQEEQKKNQLAKEDAKQLAIAAQLFEMKQQTQQRLSELRMRERMFSAQAGALLNSLTREESRANIVGNTVKETRATRKKLLARIVTPRWEIKHHYHMTCMEHALGHTQPHVMDVGEMLPGHLRLFASARRTVLLQKAMSFSLTRARNARNQASDTIKEVYLSMRSVRNDIKEAEKLLDAMKERARTIGVNFEAIARAQSEEEVRGSIVSQLQSSPSSLASSSIGGSTVSSVGSGLSQALSSSSINEDASKRATSDVSESARGSSSSSSGGSSRSSSSVARIAPSPLSYRMKYFNSLNLAPSTSSNPKAPLMVSTSRPSSHQYASTNLSSPSSMGPSSPLLMSSSSPSVTNMAGIPDLTLPPLTTSGATTVIPPGSPSSSGSSMSSPLSTLRPSTSNDQLASGAPSNGPIAPGGPNMNMTTTTTTNTNSNSNNSNNGDEMTSPLSTSSSPASTSSAGVAAAVVAAANSSANNGGANSNAGSSLLDFQAMISLMKDLEKHAGSRKKAAEELKFVQDRQNAFKKGISSLPQLKFQPHQMKPIGSRSEAKAAMLLGGASPSTPLVGGIRSSSSPSSSSQPIGVPGAPQPTGAEEEFDDEDDDDEDEKPTAPTPPVAAQSSGGWLRSLFGSSKPAATTPSSSASHSGQPPPIYEGDDNVPEALRRVLNEPSKEQREAKAKAQAAKRAAAIAAATAASNSSSGGSSSNPPSPGRPQRSNSRGGDSTPPGSPKRSSNGSSSSSSSPPSSPKSPGRSVASGGNGSTSPKSPKQVRHMPRGLM